MKEKILKFVIDKAKRSKLIQSVFEKPIDLSSFKTKGIFIDNLGNEHKLYSGLRNKIRPGWEKVFEESGNSFRQTDQAVSKTAEEGKITLERALPLLKTFCGDLNDLKILEIGCYAGGVSYAFAETGAEVTGTDYSGYRSKNNEENESLEATLRPEEISLNNLRKQVGKFYDSSLKINFFDDDICNTQFPENKYDLICSWDVLEHLSNPELAFKNMYKILKPGGFMFHEYNPFFSLGGGHRACTTDFPWGHVLLNEEDYAKLNKEYYPEFAEQSVKYFKAGINRMKINDFKKYTKEAGFELQELITFPKEQHLRMLNNKILNISRKLHPNITANDLVCSKIIAILKK